MSEFLITDTKEIALITVKNLPDNIFYISKILEIINQENIKIDYFTKQFYLKDKISVTFTVKENLISKVFDVIKKVRSFVPEVSTEIFGNNTKIIMKISENENAFLTLVKIVKKASLLKANLNILNFTDNEIIFLIPNEFVSEFKNLWGKFLRGF